MMKTPEPMSPRWASLRFRAPGRRCPMRRSVPWDGPDGKTPMGDDCERNRGRKDADAVGQRAREQEHAGCRAPRDGTEAVLQALVGRVLCALEVSRQQERRDADAADEISERDLQKR